jgi:hypothetical protein
MHDGNTLTTNDSLDALQYKPYSKNGFVSYLKK